MSDIEKTEHDTLIRTNDAEYVKLVSQISDLWDEARNTAFQAVNTSLLFANWHTGEYIVEYEQRGNIKAEYGKQLLTNLSKDLTLRLGKGYSRSNLFNMRLFYLTYPKIQTVSGQLSWSHYRLLISVENEEARQYYLDEARKSLWSVRELQRQINSFYYERLLENRAKGRRSKSAVVPLKPIDKVTPQNVIRDPLVLEFLGLDESEKFLERDLESLLISHFQKFMMEMGRGFALVARQKRLTLDGKSYHVDLVFYNYILRCFVLCDLKTDELTHADLGQMQMYVNYYERELMNPGDNPPIGIVLCTDKGADLVRYTLPLHNKRIFAAKYKLHLPSEQELIDELRRERTAIEDARLVAKLDSAEIPRIKK